MICPHCKLDLFASQFTPQPRKFARHVAACARVKEAERLILEREAKKKATDEQAKG